MSDDSPLKEPNAGTLAKKSCALSLGSVFCGITSIPAIVLAVRALLRMRKEGVGKGAWIKTIACLLFSSCTLVFFACMIIAPFRAAQAMADEMNCCNRLKNLTVAMRIYEGDNSDNFPSVNKWCDALTENVTNQSTSMILSFLCPAASKKQVCGYAMNNDLKDIKDTSRIPSDTVLLFESDAGWNGSGSLTNAVARHYGLRLWVAFVDGSVKDVRLDELDKLRWIPSTNVTRDTIK